MTRPLAVLAALLVLAACAASPSAGPDRPDLRGATVYSNLCTEAESGDTAGERLYVLPAGRLPRVYLQWTEGAVSWPEPAEFNIVNGRLHFTFSGGSDITSFSGEVYRDHADIRTRIPGAPTDTLPRGGGGDHYPPCKPVPSLRPRL